MATAIKRFIQSIAERTNDADELWKTNGNILIKIFIFENKEFYIKYKAMCVDGNCTPFYYY